SHGRRGPYHLVDRARFSDDGPREPRGRAGPFRHRCARSALGRPPARSATISVNRNSDSGTALNDFIEGTVLPKHPAAKEVILISHSMGASSFGECLPRTPPRSSGRSPEAGRR